MLASLQPRLERLRSRRAVLQLCQAQRWLLVSRFRRSVRLDRSKLTI